MKLLASHLRRARALIEAPARWCQGEWAVDANGDRVPSLSENACRWCASGALRKVAGESGQTRSDLDKLLDMADPGYDLLNLIGINDRLGHAAALAELDRLADLLEARERQEQGA